MVTHSWSIYSAYTILAIVFIVLLQQMARFFPNVNASTRVLSLSEKDKDIK